MNSGNNSKSYHSHHTNSLNSETSQQSSVNEKDSQVSASINPRQRLMNIIEDQNNKSKSQNRKPESRKLLNAARSPKSPKKSAFDQNQEEELNYSKNQEKIDSEQSLTDQISHNSSHKSNLSSNAYSSGKRSEHSQSKENSYYSASSRYSRHRHHRRPVLAMSPVQCNSFLFPSNVSFDNSAKMSKKTDSSENDEPKFEFTPPAHKTNQSKSPKFESPHHSHSSGKKSSDVENIKERNVVVNDSLSEISMNFLTESLAFVSEYSVPERETSKKSKSVPSEEIKEREVELSEPNESNNYTYETLTLEESDSKSWTYLSVYEYESEDDTPHYYIPSPTKKPQPIQQVVQSPKPVQPPQSPHTIVGGDALSIAPAFPIPGTNTIVGQMDGQINSPKEKNVLAVDLSPSRRIQVIQHGLNEAQKSPKRNFDRERELRMQEPDPMAVLDSRFIKDKYQYKYRDIKLESEKMSESESETVTRIQPQTVFTANQPFPYSPRGLEKRKQRLMEKVNDDINSPRNRNSEFSSSGSQKVESEKYSKHSSSAQKIESEKHSKYSASSQKVESEKLSSSSHKNRSESHSKHLSSSQKENDLSSNEVKKREVHLSSSHSKRSKKSNLSERTDTEASMNNDANHSYYMYSSEQGSFTEIFENMQTSESEPQKEKEAPKFVVKSENESSASQNLKLSEVENLSHISDEHVKNTSIKNFSQIPLKNQSSNKVNKSKEQVLMSLSEDEENANDNQILSESEEDESQSSTLNHSLSSQHHSSQKLNQHSYSSQNSGRNSEKSNEDSVSSHKSSKHSEKLNENSYSSHKSSKHSEKLNEDSVSSHKSSKHSEKLNENSYFSHKSSKHSEKLNEDSVSSHKSSKHSEKLNENSFSSKSSHHSPKERNIELENESLGSSQKIGNKIKIAVDEEEEIEAFSFKSESSHQPFKLKIDSNSNSSVKNPTENNSTLSEVAQLTPEKPRFSAFDLNSNSSAKNLTESCENSTLSSILVSSSQQSKESDTLRVKICEVQFPSQIRYPDVQIFLKNDPENFAVTEKSQDVSTHHTFNETFNISLDSIKRKDNSVLADLVVVVRQTESNGTVARNVIPILKKEFKINQKVMKKYELVPNGQIQLTITPLSLDEEMESFSEQNKLSFTSDSYFNRNVDNE